MDKKQLIWTEKSRKQVFNCNIFSVWESYCIAPEKKHNDEEKDEEKHIFSIIDARDWVIVIPIKNIEDKKHFVMVWQWRHGSKCLSLEFPGGVMELGEEPTEAAIRELHEETGFIPGKIEKIGEFSPNPAIMSNKVHFFLAEDLSGENKQNLDADEYVEVTLVDIEDVLNGMGNEPYVHALMGTAISLYLIKDRNGN